MPDSFSYRPANAQNNSIEKQGGINQESLIRKWIGVSGSLQ
jgi:hypothetical protein